MNEPASHRFIDAVRRFELVAKTGVVRRIMPTFLESDGPNVRLGTLCRVEGGHDSHSLAEVVKVDSHGITLTPLSRSSETFVGAVVTATPEGSVVPVGNRYLGRALNALGDPIDGCGDLHLSDRRPLQPEAVSPLHRLSVTSRLHTGVRVIDTLLSLGVGQRVGVFAGSGVGKTTLMGQLATNVDVDCCVACLVGERGREAESFWSRGLTEEARSRCAMVVATADEPAATRVRAALFALTIAEYFRDQGMKVLFLLDSATRLAMAMREMGLAAGEPPTVRAYTPSVFAHIPRLVERCGALKSGGSITAIMTVLTETDDADDPVAELMKSLLDGHIVLSRELAERGHFPAIDVPRSISRMFREINSEEERELAIRAVKELALYERSKTLLDAGLYSSGSNAELDRALGHRTALLAFLQQGFDETATHENMIKQLKAALGD